MLVSRPDKYHVHVKMAIIKAIASSSMLINN